MRATLSPEIVPAGATIHWLSLAISDRVSEVPPGMMSFDILALTCAGGSRSPVVADAGDRGTDTFTRTAKTPTLNQ